MSLNRPEPAPLANDRPASWDLVIADMEQRPATAPPPIDEYDVRQLVIADMRERDAAGAAKYGTRLQPGNGRVQLVDAYQEALDLAVYLRTELAERHDGLVAALYSEALTIVVWLRAIYLRNLPPGAGR